MPEARARQSIDSLLAAEGWAAQDLKQERIFAEVDCHRFIICQVAANRLRTRVRLCAVLGSCLHNKGDQTTIMTSVASMVNLDQ